MQKLLSHESNHNPENLPSTFEKIVGGTVYQVHVHFNDNSKENLKDKILRMLVNDVENEVVNIA